MLNATTIDQHAAQLNAALPLATVMSASLGGSTLPMPVDFTICNPTFHGNFFVRECFVEYYDEIVPAFKASEMRGATITGHPGIGKSVFMAYFLARYQRENSDATVVLFFYNDDSELYEAAVCKGGEVTMLKMADVAEIERSFGPDEDVLFLLDGPPRGIPVLRRHFVAFTRENTTWFSSMRREKAHMRRYMPLWSLQELQAAAEALNLENAMGRMTNIEDFPRDQDASYANEVAYRFSVFGGLPRPCLETNVVALDTELEKLQKDAAAVDVMTGPVRDKSGQAGQALSTRLYHCYPAPLVALSRLKIASPYVTHLLATRVNGLSHKRRARFEYMANAFAEASLLRREMLKNRLFIVLQQGVHIVASSLGCSANCPRYDMRLTALPTIPDVKPVPRHVWTQHPTKAPLLFPRASSVFESIDAFYVSKTLVPGDQDTSEYGTVDIASDATMPWGSTVQAVAFHVATTGNHGVNGRGLWALLKHLERRHGVDASRVALVFVVPAGRENRFSTKDIKGGLGVSDHVPTVAVHGVTTEMAQALAAVSVHTVGHLRRCATDAKNAVLGVESRQVVMQAQELLRQHENETVATGSGTHKLLQNVPQFVWGFGK